MYSTFAFEFQLYSLRIVSVPSALTEHGPFSPKRATSEEHPGPPVIHMTTGSVAGAERLSKYLRRQAGRDDFRMTKEARARGVVQRSRAAVAPVEVMLVARRQLEVARILGDVVANRGGCRLAALLEHAATGSKPGRESEGGRRKEEGCNGHISGL